VEASHNVKMVSQFVGRVVLLLTGGAAGATLIESRGSLADVPRSLLGMLFGGSGTDSSLNNKVCCQTLRGHTSSVLY